MPDHLRKKAKEGELESGTEAEPSICPSLALFYLFASVKTLAGHVDCKQEDSFFAVERDAVQSMSSLSSCSHF